MSEIADKLRAVLKMRATLEADVTKLDTRIANQERAMKRLRKEREAAQERLAGIEDALRPLAQLADGVIATKATPPTVIEGGRRRIDVIVEAIGKQGLDEWTLAQISAATGIGSSSVSPFLTSLVNANRIRRVGNGRYRTIEAKLAPTQPPIHLAQGA